MKKLTKKLQLRSTTVKTLSTGNLVKVQGGTWGTASAVCGNYSDDCSENEGGYSKVYTFAC